MFEIEQWLYSMITNDATLKVLLASPANSATPYNMFPIGVDIAPEQFPCVTFSDAGSILNSTTRMRIGRMRLDFWSLNSMSEIMTIYSRVAQIINFNHSRIASIRVPNNNILWWIYEVSSLDQPDTTRRLFKKTVTFKYWNSEPLLVTTNPY